MTGFVEGTRVLVDQVSETEWVTTHPIIYYPAKGKPVIVDAGFETDFASVPRPLVWFLPRTGLWTLAAILHDWLWRLEAPMGRVTWREADRLFREAMRDLGVPFLRRWVMWSAVRVAAVGKGGQHRDWLATLPAALTCGALVLPVVAVPVVSILAALVVWTIIEWVVYGVSRIFGYTPVEPGFDYRTARKG